MIQPVLGTVNISALCHCFWFSTVQPRRNSHLWGQRSLSKSYIKLSGLVRSAGLTSSKLRPKGTSCTPQLLFPSRMILSTLSARFLSFMLDKLRKNSSVSDLPAPVWTYPDIKVSVAGPFVHAFTIWVMATCYMGEDMVGDGAQR